MSRYKNQFEWLFNLSFDNLLSNQIQTSIYNADRKIKI